MKLFILPCLILFFSNLSFASNEDSVKHPLNSCKCHVIFGFNSDTTTSSKPVIDTIYIGGTNIAMSVSLQLSPACPAGSKVHSFELTVASNGISTTYASKNGCMTGEMEYAISRQNTSSYITYQGILLDLPNGKRMKLLGKTIYLKK